jgi:hypothetical protein
MTPDDLKQAIQLSDRVLGGAFASTPVARELAVLLRKALADREWRPISEAPKGCDSLLLTEAGYIHLGDWEDYYKHNQLRYVAFQPLPAAPNPKEIDDERV